MRGGSYLRTEAFDRRLKPLLEPDRHLKADPLPRTGYVQVARRLAVRARGIPDDLPLEAREPANRIGEIADLRLDSGADVERVRGFEALGAQQQRARRVATSRNSREGAPDPHSATSSSPRSAASTNLRTIAAIT